MDVYEAVRSRLTVREFKPDPVPDEVVDKLVRAGQWAASSRNLQPWHFIVVRDSDTLAKIGDIASSGRFIANAPMAIAIAMENADRADLDTGRAMQQIELVAWEEGLGTCFVGLRIAEQNSQVKQLLGVPDSFEMVTVLPFGYRLDGNDGSRGVKNRKPLSQIAHSERYGQPYA
jgi:nitroreductase